MSDWYEVDVALDRVRGVKPYRERYRRGNRRDGTSPRQMRVRAAVADLLEKLVPFYDDVAGWMRPEADEVVLAWLACRPGREPRTDQKRVAAQRNREHLERVARRVTPEG